MGWMWQIGKKAAGNSHQTMTSMTQQPDIHNPFGSCEMWGDFFMKEFKSELHTE